MILTNAFSASMLSKDEATVVFKTVSLEEAKKLVSNGFVSAVGHASTAQIASQLLGVDVPVNRVQVQLSSGDKALIFQLLTRLEEGKVLSAEEILTLPTKWILAEVL